MIASLKPAEAAKIWEGGGSRRLPPDIQRIALRKLEILDAAADLLDLQTPPGNRLEALKNDQAGQHSIRINDQWRLCFVWQQGDAHEVEIADIVNERRGIRVDTAFRLSRYFRNSAQFWLNLQTHYDLREAREWHGAEVSANVQYEGLPLAA